jgi:hypothetical protein
VPGLPGSAARGSLGSLIGPIWRGHELSAGTPVGGAVARSLEQIGFFTGLALAVAFVAAVALGRLTVIAVRDTRVASRATRGEPVTAAQTLRTPAGSPGEEPRPELVGSAPAHR